MLEGARIARTDGKKSTDALWLQGSCPRFMKLILIELLQPDQIGFDIHGTAKIVDLDTLQPFKGQVSGLIFVVTLISLP